MLVQYFGFQQDPFGASPDPRCLYLSHTHREALASLDYAYLANRGFTAMIAPPGMGKTTLLFRFLETIRGSARTVFLFDIDSHCEPQDLVAYILRDIGIVPGQSSSEMHEQLTEVLAAEDRASRHFVVVIDEAQNLSDALLERLRLLTNFETARGKLMQIVLSGQPSLFEMLMKPSLAQLRQRIATISRIEPLSTTETEAYIQHRLNFAGNVDEHLFTRDALTLIAEASKGIPRTVNNLCFNALSLCCALKSRRVTCEMVSEVMSDLQLLPPCAEAPSSGWHATQEPHHLSAPGRRSWRLWKVWAPLVSVLPVMALLGMLCISRLHIFPHLGKSAAESATQVSTEESFTAVDSASTGKSAALHAGPHDHLIEVTVEPNQWLSEISIEHLGSYDSQRLQQIQELNPGLTNPNLLRVGQKLLLPQPRAATVTTASPTPVSARTAP